MARSANIWNTSGRCGERCEGERGRTAASTSTPLASTSTSRLVCEGEREGGMEGGSERGKEGSLQLLTITAHVIIG